MKHAGNLCILMMSLVTHLLTAQTAADRDAGVQVTYDVPTEVYSVKWWGAEGHFYFIKTSVDLTAWTYIEVIEDGADGILEHAATIEEGPSDKLFVKLQWIETTSTDPYNDDFDGDGISNIDEIKMPQAEGDPLDSTSNDGDPMPDDWEVFYGLDATTDDSSEDFDEDGLTNLEEYQQGSSPSDYYNGHPPVITVLRSAKDVEAERVADWPFDLLISNLQGDYLANAPVVIKVMGGYPGLTTEADPQAQGVSTLSVRANPLGRIHPAFTPIYFIGDQFPGIQHTIVVTAGETEIFLPIYTVNPIENKPSAPQRLKRVDNPDGSRTYSWTGSPANAESFFIEELNNQGEWIRVYEVPIYGLPSPDPETGFYSVTIGL